MALVERSDRGAEVLAGAAAVGAAVGAVEQGSHGGESVGGEQAEGDAVPQGALDVVRQAVGGGGEVGEEAGASGGEDVCDFLDGAGFGGLGGGGAGGG